MFSIINTTAILFITIALGFICGKIKLFKINQDKTLIDYVFYIALPLNLFLSCYHSSWHIFNLPYLLSYSIAMVLMITLSYILSQKLLKPGKSTSIINSLSASQVDGAYFTIPLFLLIFQSDSFAIPLMLIQNTFFFMLSLLFLQISCKNKNPLPEKNHFYFIIRQVTHVITHNPIIGASLLGLIANALSIKIPGSILDTAEFIGSSASAVALFSLGLTCSFYLNSFKHKGQIYPLFCLSLLKLVMLPFISLIIGKALHLEHNLLLALVLLTASPAATHTYIIAKKYDVDVEIATFNVVLTTMLSFFSINLWLYWLSQ
jgi:malonate transporter